MSPTLQDDQYVDGYREGYKAGYSAGVTDGNSQGYSDAKHRAYVAAKAADLRSETDRHAIVDAFRDLLGPQK